MRRQLLDAYHAALNAVEPAAAVKRMLGSGERGIEVDGELISVAGSIRVAAIGKAAPAMARGAMDGVGDRVVDGVVVADRIEDVPAPLRSMRGEHPYPGAGSLLAGEALLALAGSCSEGDLLLVLVSGGASGLAEAPLDGVPLSDLAHLQSSLEAAGAPIEELNRVRRHLSRLKNGGLRRAAGKAMVVSLLMSDVADAPPSTIGSGPTLNDESTIVDARQVIEKRLPRAAVDLPERPDHDVARSTGHHRWRVVADGSVAANAAADHMARQGIASRVVTTRLNGEARLEATRLVAEAQPGVSVLAGETTVTGATSGRGGRNLEAALAAAIAFDGHPGWVFAALGTDGIDGPTDAAGAIVDGGTITRGRGFVADAATCLDRHNSYPYLETAGDLVITGPSGTNVGDLWLLYRDAPRERPDAKR